MDPLISAVREASVANPTTLVLLHGLGSNERDLMGLSPYLPKELRIVCFRAPVMHGPQGFSWFDIEWSEHGLSFSEAEMRSSLVRLKSSLDGLGADRLILGGFSQGAVMSMLVASQGREFLATPLTGAVLLSGAPLVGALRPESPIMSDLPVIIQHGRFDEVLPLRLGQGLEQQARDLGANVEYHEYPMAHQISEESLSDLDAWLSRLLD